MRVHYVRVPPGREAACVKAQSLERLGAFGDMEDDIVSWKKAGSVYESGGERKLERK